MTQDGLYDEYEEQKEHRPPSPPIVVRHTDAYMEPEQISP